MYSEALLQPYSGADGLAEFGGAVEILGEKSVFLLRKSQVDRFMNETVGRKPMESIKYGQHKNVIPDLIVSKGTP